MDKNKNNECPKCKINDCNCDNLPTSHALLSIFHSILTLIAVYLAFRCNGKLDFGTFLLACCCPYIYIIYVFATRGTCGVIEK